MLATSESGASRTSAFFSPSGLIRTLTLVTPVSRGFFTARLIWCVVALTPRMSGRVLALVRGSLMMAQCPGLFLQGALFRGNWGRRCRRCILGSGRVGEGLLLLVAVDTFQHCLHVLRSLRFDFGFRRSRIFLLHLLRHLGEKALVSPEQANPCMPQFPLF